MTAARFDLAPTGFDPQRLAGYVVSSIEQHGFVAGLIRSAFVPGLLPGLGGVAYQLLRMHPDCGLPSLLLID
jgi:lantibiotic modifying enzyme